MTLRTISILVAPPNEPIFALKSIQQLLDPEAAHGMADDVLCKLLTQLGCADVVAEYEKVEKWYA